MRIPKKDLQHGLVAVLDALGVADYTEREIRRFLRSRQEVIKLLDQKAEDMAERLSVETLTTFTFNDTVLIVMKSEKPEIEPKEIRAFFIVLRKFITDSLANGILFRGSIAVGQFTMHESTNTIMGQAISDAAAWYNQTDWIGVVATPRTSLLIERMLTMRRRNWSHIMLDYDVPLKSGGLTRLKAVNWPKVFFVPSITPCVKGENPRAKCLEFLSDQRVPLGTENKFANTLKFFDFAAQQVALEKKEKREARTARKKG